MRSGAPGGEELVDLHGPLQRRQNGQTDGGTRYGTFISASLIVPLPY